jgi:Ser/Thr protein kinase RdoA (MazF antagonist)
MSVLRPEPGNAPKPYADLTPAVVLDALDGVGLRGDGRLIQLNSYENRVFQAFLEDGRVVVAKFYRPQRWSDAQILEEHEFSAELAAAEIPVASPWRLELDTTSPHAAEMTLAGPTLAAAAFGHHAYRFGVCERFAGRAPELDEPEVLRWLGRYIGRLHGVGASARFRERLTLDVATYGEASRDWLLAHGLVSADVAGVWRGLADTALAACRDAFERTEPRQLRLHGDCHPGNVLWREGGGPHFVDLDDAVTGPAIQDLWMLLSGDRGAMTRQLLDLLEGYEAFRDFDWREVRLVEPLRTLRMLQHSAWIAKRWRDPAFPIAFPWFASPSYWADQCTRLREQLEAMAEPPLGGAT